MTRPCPSLRPILVSACLLGVACRYNGRTKHNQAVVDYLATEALLPVPVCPEQLAGLPTPRPATRFRTGDGRAVLAGQGEVVTVEGRAMNAIFLQGAEETLKIAQACGCEMALLKERSPSCGVHQVDRNGSIVPGMGVAAARLAAAQIEVFSEEDIPRRRS